MPEIETEKPVTYFERRKERKEKILQQFENRPDALEALADRCAHAELRLADLLPDKNDKAKEN